MQNHAPANQAAEILVAPTWECNLRCKYCFVKNNKIEKDEGMMTPELAVRVIDSLNEGLSSVSSICVHFYGGEPFINLPAIKAMVDRAVELKTGRFCFVATTNGTVLSDELLEVIEKGKVVLSVSIDGPEAVHDECRKKANGTPTHADVVRFIETVRAKTSCHVMGASVIRSGWTLRQAVDYLRTLPIRDIKAQAIRSQKGEPYALTDEEREIYKKDLEYVGQLVIQDLEAGRLPMDGRFSSRVLQVLANTSRDSFCGAGLYNFGITPNGKVYPCILINNSESLLGNVTDDPKVWVEAGKQWVQRVTRVHKPECQSCSSFKLCGGGCPVVSSVCGEEECDLVHKNCDVTMQIYNHFKETDNLEALLGLIGVF